MSNEINLNPLTDKEIAYYKDIGDFSYSRKDAETVGDRESKIDYMAYEDILYRKPRRTNKDFKNNSEYKYYLLSLYNYAMVFEAEGK